MNDCINREAFIGEMEKHYCAPCKGQGGDLGGDWCHSCVINSVLEKMREFPAADVAPVVHGRWIDKGWDGDINWQIDGRGSCWRVHECSECKAQQKMETTNYCPNCGAKMDKEEP